MALLASCSKDLSSTDAGIIRIDAYIGTLTKLSYEGDNTSFTAGDQIAVYAWQGKSTEVPDTRQVDGVVNTLGTDGTWVPASAMLWTPGNDAHYFLGVYPVHSIASFTADPYTLDPAAYEVNDLLIATRLDGVKASDGPVALSFDHAMARLSVNLQFRSEFDTAPAVSSVTVNARSSATVNYLTKAVTATGDAAAVNIPAAASVPTGYDLSFSGIIVPQEGVRTVTINIGTREFVYTSAANIPLHSGQHTTLDLMVGKDRIELGSLSVADWSAGANLACDEAVLKPRACVDMGGSLLWATCNVGAVNPWDYGDYFAWGETTTKDFYDESTYNYFPGGKYTMRGAVIEPEDDAARVNWGEAWRMPTEAEWVWLRDHCSWTWTTDYKGTGVNGMLVTSKVDGYTENNIFLPAAGDITGDLLGGVGSSGYYWCPSLDGDIEYFARKTYISEDGVGWNMEPRHRGISIRPVKEK